MYLDATLLARVATIAGLGVPNALLRAQVRVVRFARRILWSCIWRHWQCIHVLRGSCDLIN